MSLAAKGGDGGVVEVMMWEKVGQIAIIVQCEGQPICGFGFAEP